MFDSTIESWLPNSERVARVLRFGTLLGWVHPLTVHPTDPHAENRPTTSLTSQEATRLSSDGMAAWVPWDEDEYNIYGSNWKLVWIWKWISLYIIHIYMCVCVWGCLSIYIWIFSVHILLRLWWTSICSVFLEICFFDLCMIQKHISLMWPPDIIPVKHITCGSAVSRF